MKENVFDVLMYLFENYVDEGPEFDPDQEALSAELAEAGFARGEIRKAFSWLEELSALRTQQPEPLAAASPAVRHYTPRERDRLNPECRGFLHVMETTGVLTPLTREIVIDRVMALEAEDIDLEQLKWVTRMVLFNQPGHEAAYDILESLVFEDLPGQLH
jgi:Smg protein